MRIAIFVCGALVTALAFAQQASEPAAAEIRLTSHEAVRLALQQNLSLNADRSDPGLTPAAEHIAAAFMEPVWVNGITLSKGAENLSPARAGLEPAPNTGVGGYAGVRKTFSTGTSIEGRFSTDALLGAGARGGLDPAFETGLYLVARQALLQGNSSRTNLASLTSAQLAREAALAALEREAELLAAATLKSYWDLRAAVAKLAIQELALQLTEQTLQETTSLIEAGKLPSSEQASAAYGVQLQRRAKVQAEQEVANARDELARLIGLVGPGSLETPTIVPVSAPGRTPRSWQLADLNRQAQEQRRDFRALQIATRIRHLNEQVAQHDLLPKLDMVSVLQLTGVSGEAVNDDPARAYGRGYGSSYHPDSLGYTVGLELEMPILNTEARARRDIASLELRQAEMKEDVALQAISLDLNIAWRAVQSARQQLRLTEEAARVAELKLANETARYHAGKVTAHILSSVQAEAITERLGREQALANLVKANVDLEVAAGVLLSTHKLLPNGEDRP